MSKVYLVVSYGWEYNDEYYYRPESDGYTATAAYSNWEEATKAARLAERREIDNMSYLGEFSNGEVNDFDTEKLLTGLQYNNPDAPKDLEAWGDAYWDLPAYQYRSRALNETLYSELAGTFYTVIELEVV